MALPANFLEEVRARTPLPSLVGRRVRLTRNGRQWKGCCPFHNEKTPSFYCYDDHYHCFGCGAHGDAIRFVMETEGAAFRDAVERLAAEAGLEVPKESPRAVEREQRARDLHEVLELACDALRRRLRAPEGGPALDYLRRRGLSDETVELFGLGWSGGGRGALAAELAPLGVEAARLVEAGLCRASEQGGGPSDFFFNRVMFPIRDRRGRIVSFGGRVLGDGQPKYLNGPETELFSKRRTLYGLHLAREAVFRDGARLIAVEGYMDVIALHQAGFRGAVAPLGTALTEDQLGEMWRVSPEPVLSFDKDAAGDRAALRTVRMAMPLLGEERSLRLLALPGGAKDPDEFIAREGAAAFAVALDAARPLSEALFDMLTPRPLPTAAEGWASFRRTLEEWAGTVADRALSAEFRRSLLDRFFAVRNEGRARGFQASDRGAPSGRPSRGGAPRRPPVRVERRPIVPETARLEQARCLLAITLAHPWILDEVEEACALLDLPEGQCRRLHAGMFAWHGGDASRSLDSASLAAHLHATDMGELFEWAKGAPGLPAEARPDSQPADALRAWWHFYAFLRGEASLIEDKQAAEQAWIATNDPAAEQRLRRLSEALLAVRRGELDDDT